MNSTACIENLVGVKDFAAHTSETGVFINELPGISLKRAANTSDSDFVSGAEMLSDCIKRACRHIADEIGEIISPNWKVLAGLEVRLFGKEAPAPNYTANGNETVGVRIKTLRTDRLAGILISRIALGFTSSSPVTVTITDGITTQTLTIAAADTNKYKAVNYFSPGDWVEITYTRTPGDVYGDNSISMNGCKCGVVEYANLGAYGIATGAAAGDKAFGLSIEAVYQCDEARLICALKHRLTYLVLYKAGAMVCEEMAYSERMNPVSILDRDQAEKLAEKFSNEFARRSKIFTDTLPAVLSGLSVCVKCNSDRRYAETM